jgi:hypothetical protein
VILAAVSGTYAGIQAWAANGIHQDVAGTQHGAAVGGFIEVQGGGKRVFVHFEGVPVVGVPQRPSLRYGAATPAVGILDAALRFAFGRNSNYFAGFGADAINERTPLPNVDQVVASRLAGFRYEAGLREPLGSVHFLEASIGAVPTLYGSDVYTYSIAHPSIVKPEQASEIDYSVAFGVRARSSEVLIGLRAIDFSAHYTANGLAADRNVGFGLLAEWRATFDPQLDGGPGCIAAITSVPSGPVQSGQSITFTDGTIVSPTTHFVSRSWSFGDGTTETSGDSNATSVTHAYQNHTGRTQLQRVRLTEHTGLSDCSAQVQIQVEPAT